jgi:hypothetical protein
MRISTWLCAVLAVALALGAPLSAVAQAPQPYPYPGSERSAKPPDPPDPSLEPTDGDKAGAFFLNTLYVPGKFVICTTGTLASFAVMVLTLGSGYRQAVGVFKEGCHGDWILTPEHVSGKIGPRDDAQSY